MKQDENGSDEDHEYADTNLDGDEKNEELNDDDIVYQITTSGADFDVDGLVKRFDRGAIYRPEFQRNFVWTWPQASKFIEIYSSRPAYTKRVLVSRRRNAKVVDC